MDDKRLNEILEYQIAIKAAEKYGDLPKLADEVFSKTEKISKLIIQYIEGLYSAETDYPEDIKEIYLKAKKFSSEN